MAQVLAGILIAATIEARAFTVEAIKEAGQQTEQLAEYEDRVFPCVGPPSLPQIRWLAGHVLKLTPTLYAAVVTTAGLVGTTFALMTVVGRILLGGPSNSTIDALIYVCTGLGLAGIVAPPLLTLIHAGFKSKAGVFIAIGILVFGTGMICTTGGLAIVIKLIRH